MQQRARPIQTQRAESPAPWTLPRMLALPAFGLLYWYVSSRWSFKPTIAIAYVVVSLIAFLAYALDKSAAVRGAWRTQESTLHFLGLACGWPGALLAQQVLRHKTSKPSFVATFWGTVLLNSAALYTLHSPLAANLRI